MKFTRIPDDTFKNLQLNAGILLSSFNPSEAEIAAASILGATTGGVNFTATPTYTDFGEDIDNCPKNMKELKRLESWEAKMSGTFTGVTADLAKMLAGAADKADESGAAKVTPRNDLSQSDFADVWWVGDYSAVNDDSEGGSGTAKAGFVAVHLLNSLSTGGFQIQSTDKAKGQFAFEFTGHYSMDDQEKVPFEIYVKQGVAA